MRVVYMGSGAFGLPTVKALHAEHDVALVVSQPDRTAGRGRQLRATPIAEWALDQGLELDRPADVNEPSVRDRIHAIGPDALVVIAFGQKLGPDLLEGLPAFNLHASLLPAYRGAAPINRAMMDGCDETGVSVIALAQRMDAGAVFATERLMVDPGETAGELHDRLSDLGPMAVNRVLQALENATLAPVEQDEALATRADKLHRSDATVRFDQPATLARARIHGLTPWPGCDVLVDGRRLRLLRVRDDANADTTAEPGTLLEDGTVACSSGVLHLLEVQPAGKKPMSFDDWRRGHQVPSGVRLEPVS